MTDGNPTNYFVHTLLRARDWQHRPQLDEVKAWWRGGGRGVCALVGMGGAGKTAIVERFLRTLPGGLPEDPDIPRDESLPKPHSTFVFSFYDAPNPEAFFEALQMWLEHTPRVKTILAVNQLIFLLQQTRGLMILDGLEKVQEDGSRGVFGRLLSPKLRDFLDHLAAGYVPQLSALVTSRFPLADLRDARPQFFRTIPVDQIDVWTGIQLLRDRGVHGNDLKLAPIVEECGRHALTVDLAGGYIKEYGGGDPTTQLGLGSAEDLSAAAERELDEERREVLRQGYRFARIAERYREAILRNDEAAIMLLERICLFRLGVDRETLAAIFTGPDATKISGEALASLDTAELQKKLDWLVRMRIVEATEVRQTGATGGFPASAELDGALITGRSHRILEHSESSSKLTTEDSKLKTVYSIHPAVRDGFLSGIGREAAEAHHEAVRKALEVTLGDAPGKNPSDPATLDMLEEIVHHAIHSGHVPEGWDIHWNRIGGYKNLGHRLGAYERGERICRAFAGGKPPEYVAECAMDRDCVECDRVSTISAMRDALPYLVLPEDQQVAFVDEWAMYLCDLGRLSAGARCFELSSRIDCRNGNWTGASGGKQNLCEVYLRSGRLVEPDGALVRANEALRLAEHANDLVALYGSYAYRAYAHALTGEIRPALADFCTTLERLHEMRDDARSLWSLPGIWHAQLLARLGRCEEATRVTEANTWILIKGGGTDHKDIPQCDLMLSDLPADSLDFSFRESLCRSAQEWAEVRNAKEVLCRSALVKARIELRELSAISLQPSANEDAREIRLAAVRTAMRDGLRIARDCGFGLHYIDLLFERARVHLLQGDPQAALHDIDLALDKGIEANEETGQPELLAANHEECGYAWAIPFGLQLRAEALLLQAAQKVPSVGWAQPVDGALPPLDVGALSKAHPRIGSLIDRARECLDEALAKWQPLHDPEPECDDQNFKHPETGEEYNFRAEETWQIIQSLEGGRLTRYPLNSMKPEARELLPQGDDEMVTHQFNDRRLQQVEGLLKTQYDILHEYEKELQKADFEARVRIRLRMKDELLPQLRKYEEEYAGLLADGANVDQIPEDKANEIVADLVEVTQRAERDDVDRSDEMVALLQEIRTKLNEPGKSAAAKLKVALPIVPTLVSYELELDTENFITKVWRRARDFFRGIVQANPQ